MEHGSIESYRELLIVLGVAGVIVPVFVRIGMSSILVFLFAGILPMFLGLFVALRAAVVPEGFGKYGHYRAGALEDNQKRQTDGFSENCLPFGADVFRIHNHQRRCAFHFQRLLAP